MWRRRNPPISVEARAVAKSKIVIIAAVLVSLLGVMAGSGTADLDDSYADEVVSFTQGHVWDNTKDEPPGTWGWTDKPEEALGGPTKAAADGNAYFVSLGANPAGDIILKFTDRMLIDGQANAGYDLAIHEFGAADDACVYLANDRNEDGLPDSWVYLGYTATDASASRLTGVHPSYISGESTSILFMFDVAGKLDAIGGWASFIRILDDNKGRTDPNFTDGFDLNAVEILNYATMDEINAAEDDSCPEEEEPEESCGSSCKNYCNFKCSGIHYQDCGYGQACVWGKVHFDAFGSLCHPAQVTVCVGQVTETFPMTVKDKKGKTWEYKCSECKKGSIIKDMKIDWDKEDFEIHIDKTCLNGVSTTPDVKITCHDYGYSQNQSVQKGYWWNYKFSNLFSCFW
jgi:hypothetical protein